MICHHDQTFTVSCGQKNCQIKPETEKFMEKNVAIHIWNARLSDRKTEVKTTHEVEQDEVIYEYEWQHTSRS